MRNPKQLNLIVLKKELLKSVENMNRTSDENLNSNGMLNKTSQDYLNMNRTSKDYLLLQNKMSQGGQTTYDANTEHKGGIMTAELPDT